MTGSESIFHADSVVDGVAPNGSISIALSGMGWLTLLISTIMFVISFGAGFGTSIILYAIYAFGASMLLLALGSIVGNLNKIVWMLQHQGFKIKNEV